MGRLLKILAESLDIGGDMERLDIGDLANLVPVDPGEEPHGGVVIGLPRVLVADGGGKEFKEATRGLFAGLGDPARHHDAVANRILGAPAGGGSLSSLNGGHSGYSAQGWRLVRAAVGSIGRIRKLEWRAPS